MPPTVDNQRGLRLATRPEANTRCGCGTCPRPALCSRGAPVAVSGDAVALQVGNVASLLKPAEVVVRELAERDATAAALLRILFQQRLLVVMLANELEHLLAGLRLEERSVRRPASLATPVAVVIQLDQARPRARMTGAPPRHHFPYQRGPLVRSRM